MNLSQLITLAIIPKFSGSLSFIGSTYVIFDVLKDAKKRQTTYHRLVLGISFSDALSSLSFALGTWVMPKGSTWGAIGTVGSCDITAFFAQGGTLGTIVYNVVLMTYYLLMLKYRWSTTKLKRVEPWLHAFALLCSWGVAIIGLVKNLYASAIYVCWIGPYPANCNSPETCLRGWNYDTYRWAFVFGPAWVSLVYMLVSMFAVYVAVRDLESKSKLQSFIQTDSPHNGDTEKQAAQMQVGDSEDKKVQKEVKLQGEVTTITTTTIKPLCQPSKNQIQEESTRQNSKKSRRIMVQAFLYFCALSITWTFSTITKIILTINNRVYFPLLCLGSIFTPSQGLFNCLIYFRYKISRWYKQRQRQQEIQKEDPNKQKHIVLNQEERQGQGQAQFNFNQWLESRDKTGLGGLNYDCDGINEEKEEM